MSDKNKTKVERGGVALKPKKATSNAKVMAMFFLLAVIVAVGAYADTETVDGYAWSYRINDGTAEIYKERRDRWGAIYGTTAISPLPKGAVRIPSTLGGKPVTSIGEWAFDNCKDLTNLTIPDSVTSIGALAFWNCRRLTRVTIPNGLRRIEYRMFEGCAGLTSINIPSSVILIGKGVFQDCRSLASVAIPDSVTVIGESAFQGCLNLTSVTMLENGVRRIEDNAFSNCTSLASIKIPASVIRIGNRAFHKCSGLTRVGFRGNEPVVGKDAFSGVSPECRVYLPEGNPTYELANGKWHGMKVEWYKAEQSKETNPTRNAVESKTARQIAKSTTYIGTGLYMVIDLSGGKGAKKFPVTYLNAEPRDGWTDEYKTTKLVLRRINPGSFVMGSPADELGRDELGREEDRDGWNEMQHKVTITRPFYIGVFEVTQKQYELVTDALPLEYLIHDRGDMRPIAHVSWDTIRGDLSTCDWPSVVDVAPASFMGIIRAKTGIATFDLPTEAMWEYACRAGTTTALNSGKNLADIYKDENVAEVARYNYNTSGRRSIANRWIEAVPDFKGGYRDDHTTVGCYKPNDWGLYDMHGNVAELCLDWLDSVTPLAAKDPVGPVQSTFLAVWGDLGNCRVARGGASDDFAERVRSAKRSGIEPSRSSKSFGFRLCCFTKVLTKDKYESSRWQNARQKVSKTAGKRPDKGGSTSDGGVALDKVKPDGPYVSKSRLHADYRSKDRKHVFVEVCHQHDNNMFSTPRFTLDRIKAAIKAKADIVFLSLSKSKDGVLFAADPKEIENFTNETGSIGDYTANQLKHMKVKKQGQLTNNRLVTLEEVLKVGKGKILFKVCYFRENAKELDALLERLDAWESVIVGVHDVESEKNASTSRLWNNIRSGKLLVETWGSKLAEWREVTLECSACSGNDDLQNEGAVNIPERVFAAFTYGPGGGGRSDDEAGWEKALREGVTVFRTDRPSELIRFLKKRSRR